MARNLQPLIIIMDINLPDISGIETTRLIKTELPDTKVLALTIHDNDEYVVQMVRAGQRVISSRM